MRHRLHRRYGHARKVRKDPTAWRDTPKGDADYRIARAEAQRKANETGFDYLLEANDLFHSYMVSMLPGKKYRSGHELRGEVVMCENMATCQPGHGPLGNRP
jgi:hypothetical protein